MTPPEPSMPRRSANLFLTRPIPAVSHVRVDEVLYSSAPCMVRGLTKAGKPWWRCTEPVTKMLIDGDNRGAWMCERHYIEAVTRPSMPSEVAR